MTEAKGGTPVIVGRGSRDGVHRMDLRLPESLRVELGRIAAEGGWSRNTLIVRALTEFVRDYPQEQRAGLG